MIAPVPQPPTAAPAGPPVAAVTGPGPAHLLALRGGGGYKAPRFDRAEGRGFARCDAQTAMPGTIAPPASLVRKHRE